MESMAWMNRKCGVDIDLSEYRLMALRDIPGSRFTFRKGQRLRGRQHRRGSWIVWHYSKRNVEKAYIVGVPNDHVKVMKK